MKTKAFELLEKADQETRWLMFRFLHSNEFVEGHIFGLLNLSSDKNLKEFIDFFDDKLLDTQKVSLKMASKEYWKGK